MALGDGTGWDITSPAGTDNPSNGDDEIRDLRTGVGIRMDKEHVTLATSSAGGEHKAGSAKGYHDITSTFPTNRPDGVTLDTDDAGRIAFIDGVQYVWTGTAWDTTRSGSVTVSSGGTWVTLTQPFRAIAVHKRTNGINFIALANPLSDESDLEINATDDTGTTIYYTIDTEQSDPYRFKIKSATEGGNHHYQVLF